MSVYRAPLSDMLFTMREVGGLDAVCSLPPFSEVAPDLVESILEEAGKFASSVLQPLNRPGDVQGARWRQGQVHAPDGFGQAYAAFCDAGWHGMPAPAQYGGQGLPALVSTAAAEMWKSANMAFGLCQMLTLGAVDCLIHHASPWIKDRFVAPMVAGRFTGTMNITEPQAGSDLAGIRTRAEPDGDHFLISGSKIFITWGEHDMAENVVHLVLARMPDAPSGTRGLSLFVCPKFLVNEDGSLGARNDLQCTAIEHKLGIHGSPTASMSFGDQGGAKGYLVGELNQGLACMFTMMNHARLNVGLEGVGIAEAAYQHALAYARERVQGKPVLGGSAIVGHPDVRRMLMNMKSKTQAMRALAYFCAGQMDKANAHPDAGERAKCRAVVDLITPIVKAWCTDVALDVASDGIQIHGGMGFVEETGAAQFFRDVRISSIYEGTNGIQALDLVGRKIIRDEGRTMRRLLESMRLDAVRLLESTEPDLARVGTVLHQGHAALGRSVDWLLSGARDDARLSGACAAPFLRLAGVVLGGWLMGRTAESAAAQICANSPGIDASHLRARRLTALHFADHVLTHAEAFSRAVIVGSSASLAIEDAQL